MKIPRRTVTALCILALAGSVLARESLRPVEGRRLEVFDVRFLEDASTTEWGVLPPTPRLRGCGLPSYEPYGWIFSESDPTFTFEIAEEEPSDELVALQGAIRALIAEDSWNNTRNLLALDGGWMTVVQTPGVLEKIQRFLRGMEGLARQELFLDVAVVPAEALDETAPGWSRSGASPWLQGDVLEQAVRAGGRRAGVLSSRMRPGVPRGLQPRRVSRHLVDLEVNQTGVIPVVHPLVANVLQGTFTSAVVRKSPSGSWSRVDIVLGRMGSPEQRDLRRVYRSEIELLRQRQERVSTSVVVPHGHTVVAGSWTSPAPGGEGDRGAGPRSFVTLVRVSASEGAGTPGVLGEGIFAVDVGVLVEPPPDQRLSRVSEEGYAPPISFTGEAEEEAVTSLSAEVLDEKIREALPEEARKEARIWRRGGRVLIRAPGVRPEDVRRNIDALARSRSRVLQVDLLQATVEPGVLTGAEASGAILDEACLDAFERPPGKRARLHHVAGAAASMASVLSRNYLADIEKVSGGTGVEIVDVADPDVRQVGEGLILNVDASLVPGTPWVELHIEGEVARTPSLERKARARLDSTVEVRGAEAASADVQAVGEWVELDLPEEDSDRWEHAITVPLGKPVLLNALPAADGSGKVRVLASVVHAFEVATEEAGE